MKIIGLDTIKKMKGIRNVFLTIKKGDIIKDYKNSVDRVAYIISEGNSFEEAKRFADNAIKKLKIITRWKNITKNNELKDFTIIIKKIQYTLQRE